MPSDRTDLKSKHALGIDPTGWLLLQDPVWVFDLRSNRVVWANAAALTFWRAESPGELYARDMGAQSDVTRARLADYAAQFERGEAVEATWTLYPRGVEQTVRCHCCGVPLATGHTAMLVHAIETGEHLRADGSSRGSSDDLREARDQLARTEARYRAFAEAGSDWLWETDEEHRFIYVSKKIEEFFGHPIDTFLGRTRMEVADDLGTEVYRCGSEIRWVSHEADLAARRSFREFEYCFQNKLGVMSYCAISGDPVFDATGTFTGYRGIGRDITRRVEAETQARELQRERDVALTANSVTNQLLATMSHELRTPLNAIIGFSEVMLRELMGPMGNPVYHEYAQVVFDSANHLLGIVEDLLNVSRTDFGQNALDIEHIDAEDFLREVVRMTSHLARERNLVLDYKVHEAGLTIDADRRGLRQVVLNLISNAIKFSPDGSLIEVACRRLDNGGSELTVRDMGSGIDPADIPHVFEPFRSVDPLVARETGGVGLGLWITKRIVEAHGGRIAIESAPGVGTTVTVSLPVHAPDTQPDSRYLGEGV